MSEKSPLPESKPAAAETPATPTPPRRSPGHRGQDVRDTVAEMAARAHEISLEAGSKMAAAMKDVINAAAGLTGCFRTIVDDGDVAHGKPHPESYELAVSILARDAPGLAPAEVVAFEDTEAGVASAKSAGVRCIALARTLPPERLRLADEIVDAVDESLLRRLLG